MIGNILYSFFVILSFALSYGLICLISNKEETYHINMLGNFNIINALCAIAIAKELNMLN